MTDIEWTKGTIMVYSGFGILGFTIILIILDLILSKMFKKRRAIQEDIMDKAAIIHKNNTQVRPTDIIGQQKTEKSKVRYTDQLNTAETKNQLEETAMLENGSQLQETELLHKDESIDTTMILKPNQQESIN